MIFKNQIYLEDIRSVAESIPWNNISGKKILITGSTGMIGRILVDIIMFRNSEADDNIAIVACGRDKNKAEKLFADYWNDPLFEFLKYDVNEALCNDIRYDIIIHGASNTHPLAYAEDPVGTITKSVIGTLNLLEHAVKTGIDRFVFLSTVEIYGENNGDVESFTENYCGYIDCNTLRAGYPEGKRTGEALCQAFFDKYKIDFVIPRLSRIYGPTMAEDDTKASSQFIRNAAQGKDIVLKSEGTQRFSYTYVTDAAYAIMYITSLGKSCNAYNIAVSDVSLRDMATKLSEIAGTSVVFEKPSNSESKGASKVTKAVMDSSKLKELGWSGRVDMETGLNMTLKLLKEHNFLQR